MTDLTNSGTRELTDNEISEELSFAPQVRDIIGDSRLAFVDTYGCQQNEADSERIRGLLRACGYGFTHSAGSADIIVINTCSVRDHAEAKVFGVIGSLLQLKKERPGLIICVCGCMAQREGIAERLRTSYKHVDVVFGTHALPKFPRLLFEFLSTGQRIFDTKKSDGTIAEGLPAVRDGTVKAWLSIMYGCNNFCSYCVVPYVRGRERSRKPGNIIRDFEKLLESGARDITLLGQNVNSYSHDFPQLLRDLDKFGGEYRIRFMTSHPKDASYELFGVMAESAHIAKCLHLPFQSGSSRILELMNRRYTREQYMEKISGIRSLIPDITLTSDVIVGFPGEELSDFEQTMSLIEQVRYDSLFTFIYSKRPGAPSYFEENNTPEEEIKRRFDRLVKRQNEISEEKHKQLVGKTMRVLIDGEGTARTGGNRLVRFDQWTASPKPGDFCDMRITGSTRWSLVGELNSHF